MILNSAYSIALSWLIIFITSCNSIAKKNIKNRNSMHWGITKISSETGANSFDYDLNQYFIQDSLTGYIIGDNSIAEMYRSIIEKRVLKRENYEAILFKTEDGGVSFRKRSLGKGSLQKITSDNEKNLYVIQCNYKTASLPKRYRIMYSRDLGETWQEMAFPQGKKIETVQFYNGLKGVVAIEEDGMFKLLKTKDGGKTWEELPVKETSLSYYSIQFINEKALYVYNSTEGLRQAATINFTTGKVKIHNPNLPKGYRFSSFIKDESNGDLLSPVRNYKEGHKLMVYNHTKRELLRYDLNNAKGERVLAVHVYGNYIGALRRDNGKTHYYYSIDNGVHWVKESLPDYFTVVKPIAMYGKGLVWVKSAFNLYNLQVRTMDN
ncbi:WD40/YVTN/BNR-like repeat-containing protein [Tenacibaculum maritimum]|uniref:WD40/YVTN/BNR-like repeat-containing protein n=5 Tax=Tenacibaculum maritimum TaxID=107401 RepID=UPI0038768C0D